MGQSHESSGVGLDEVRQLTHDLYLPFLGIERDILVPGTDRDENVAEHSFHLSLVAAAIGERLGLDPGLCATYAVMHDITEYIEGDVSFMDTEGKKTKKAREERAMQDIEITFRKTPFIYSTLKAYEQQMDEESCFVYALDKLVATLLILRANGATWKRNGQTFDEYIELIEREMKPKVATYPIVAEWFEQAMEEVHARNHELFIPEEA